ncbi:MAG: phosphoribosylamine--glycine ligase [FCB group bacterium]|jgi:phosphoribosylamine--glycine ligase
MKILLIGSGGREHALAHALSKSSTSNLIFAYPGNPGIFQIAQKTFITKMDFMEIKDFCIKEKVDLIVVGPEQPLADGISDYLRNVGLIVFGPSKNAARLESSKGWAKDFMQRHNIPTAKFKKFKNTESKEAHDYLEYSKYPLVIKADGLASGKGVIIANNSGEAQETLDSIFGGMFKEAGNSVVIEEFLDGVEASIMAVCDGNDFVILASSQDHKKIFDGDKGKNTGGMGAYAPTPFVTDELILKVKAQIIIPVIEGMKKEGEPFIGCLYAGLMICDGEPYVIEFNVRFGDPETQAVLSIFDGNFAGLLYSAAKGKIENSTIKNISNGFACCVILASEGYPDSYKKGFPITGIEKAEKKDLIVYHAGTTLKEGELLTDGGRVLGVTGTGQTLQQAVENAYIGIEKINFENKYYRKDIAGKALKN